MPRFTLGRRCKRDPSAGPWLSLASACSISVAKVRMHQAGTAGAVLAWHFRRRASNGGGKVSTRPRVGHGVGGRTWRSASTPQAAGVAWPRSQPPPNWVYAEEERTSRLRRPAAPVSATEVAWAMTCLGCLGDVLVEGIGRERGEEKGTRRRSETRVEEVIWAGRTKWAA